MKKLLILSLFFYTAIYGDEALEKYLSYIKKFSYSNGDYQEGEIEVVVDPAEIYKIQKIQENRLLKKGFSSQEALEFSRIGVISEDQYWIWLRDAVYFPQKVPGTYDRFVAKNELKFTPHGVAVFPLLKSGQIALLLNYRHATRSWELELPRGSIDPGETPQEAALRELEEETGLKSSSLTFLGEVALDTGIISSVIPIFFAEVSSKGASQQEDSEAIAGIILLTKKELTEGLVRGFLEMTIEGEKKEVPLRDSFLAFALLQAELRQLLNIVD